MPVNPQSRTLGAREVVLSFNDGPDLATTPKILETLATHGIRALFFVVGQQLHNRAARRIVRQASIQGHTIAGHSYTHTSLRRLPDHRIREELRRTHDLIFELTGVSNRLVRPPFGATDGRVESVIRDAGFQTVMWNVDSLDWQKRGMAWVNHTVRQLKSKQDCLVVLHDTERSTARYLDPFIEKALCMRGSTRFVPYQQGATGNPLSEPPSVPNWLDGALWRPLN